MAGEGERVSVVVIFIDIGNTESRSDLDEFVDLALLTLSILLTHVMRKAPSFHLNWG